MNVYFSLYILGRQMSHDATKSVLLWVGECLNDPGLASCGAHGFTISAWIKLVSVSQERLRYYMNSGDVGPKSLTTSDYRGVAIFTDTSLLGVSVSQLQLDWVLVLDSSSYKLGE